MDGARTGAYGTGKCDIHPGFELHPGRHGRLASERVTGQSGCDSLPRREVRCPGPVEGGQASVAFLQPGPHAFQRGRRKIEVPSRGEISDAALVSQVVKKRAPGRLRACDLRQSGPDAREPGRIGETGLAMENGQVLRIPPLMALGLVEQPGHRAIGHPAVIGGVEVGCQILGVPAQPDAHPLFRTVPAGLREGLQQLGAGDPQVSAAQGGWPQADPAT